MTIRFDAQQWALILGGSSGFGLATAKKLASHGMWVAVVHRDRRGAMKAIEPHFEEIRSYEGDQEFVSFNLDALSQEGRDTVIADLKERLGDAGRVRMMLHSIAFGNLRLMAPLDDTFGASAARARAHLAAKIGISEEQLDEVVEELFTEGGEETKSLVGIARLPTYNSDSVLEDEDFDRTVYSMGTSLSSWTRDVFRAGLFADDARVLSMTSEGNEVAWRGYAAVAAAKVALESVSRAIAVEYAPYGIRSNVVQAGVTDSAALRLIPGSAHMKATAALRNPFGRLTTPEEVADVIFLLCTEEARWVNGTIVRVDGGEHIAG
ncbi:MAG: SDR family oxidoreductase [Candidatus Latescibacterota bacterium]|nr:SDR family oxidoreductase [Candidatus Latescibacterota bacterium]